MPRASHVQLDTTVLDRIIRNSGGNTADMVRAVAFNVEGKAKKYIQEMHAIDTGALVNSVYTRTHKGDNQNGRSTSKAQVDGEVHQRRPAAETTDLPTPANDREAYVGPSVAYGVHVHYGTGRMAGRPFLANAVRDAERELEAQARHVCTDGER